MDPLTIGLLAGAALGVGKSIMGGQEAKRKRKAEGTIAQWSPWTGMSAQRVDEPDTFGNILQGGATGAMLGQGIGAAGAAGGGAAGAAGAGGATAGAAGSGAATGAAGASGGGAALSAGTAGAGAAGAGQNMRMAPGAANYSAYGAQTAQDQALLAKYPWLRMS